MKKLTTIILSAFAFFGISNASTSIGDKKIDLVSNIDEDSELILENAKDYQNIIEDDIQMLAYHYSHQSHSSHSSHQSHYSHYSGR